MSIAAASNKKLRFGEVIGHAPGGVPAYSSHYDSADPQEFPTRRSYIGHHGGIYTGYRYQCVEFARRWLLQTQGITFGDVGMAYEVMDIAGFEVHGTEEPVHIDRTPNGGKGHLPVLGSVILWHPRGYFNHTGHIAIITHTEWHSEEDKETGIKVGKVGVAEQNVTDAKWGEGAHFSRELEIHHNSKTGQVTIYDNHYANTIVLGWVTPKHVVEAGGAVVSTTSKI